jgi:hypothetical protein
MTAKPSAADAYVRQTHLAVVITRILLAAIFVAGAVWSGSHFVRASNDGAAASKLTKPIDYDVITVEADQRVVQSANNDLTTAQASDDSVAFVVGGSAARQYFDGVLATAASALAAAQKIEDQDNATLNIDKGTKVIEQLAQADNLITGYWIAGGTIAALLIGGGILLALSFTAGRARAMVALAREPQG